MRILIVSATTLEINPLLKQFTFQERVDAQMNRYIYKKMTIDVLTTGVGMVPTAFFMGKALTRHTYNGALNLGIAGSFDHDLELGEVVHITHDQFPELGNEQGEYFLSLIDLKLLEENYFPYRDGQVINELPIKSKTINKLKTVRSITVNRTHTTNKSIEKIRQRCNPATESMEGAAFFFACLAEDVPCAQIRAVSNYVEQRDSDRWSIPKAIENLNKVILQVLHE
ncbi:MAG: futalosine hydrolase [Bacteroidetes bacterium]|nr:MAG: futalosine hydrolase [Bacteroidota bacterium]